MGENKRLRKDSPHGGWQPLCHPMESECTQNFERAHPTIQRVLWKGPIQQPEYHMSRGLCHGTQLHIVQNAAHPQDKHHNDERRSALFLSHSLTTHRRFFCVENGWAFNRPGDKLHCTGQWDLKPILKRTQSCHKECTTSMSARTNSTSPMERLQ